MTSSPHALSSSGSSFASSFSSILTSTLVALRHELASTGIQRPAWTSLSLLRGIRSLYILVSAASMTSASATAPGQTRAALARSLLLGLTLTLRLLLLALLLAKRIRLRPAAAAGSAASCDGQSGCQCSHKTGSIAGRRLAGQRGGLLVLALPERVRRSIGGWLSRCRGSLGL